MKPKLLLALALCTAASLVSMCSVSGPVAGTETGNPGFTTLAGAAFGALDDAGGFDPSSYLPGGAAQLDPGYIEPAPIVMIAKRARAYGDSLDTIYVEKIFNANDTVIRMDTVYVKDTLVSNRIEADSSSGNDSAASWKVNSERLLTDTLLVSDTVLVPETTLVARSCTVTVPVVVDSRGDMTPAPSVITDSPASQDVKFQTMALPGTSRTVGADSVDASGAIYWVPANTEKAAISIIPPDTANIVRKSDGSLMSISRTTTLEGAAVYEEYRDADGDNLLYYAAGGLSPSTRLLATYLSGTKRTEVSVQFDAGVDKAFETHGDNRIHTLRRTTRTGADTTEEIVYGAQYAPSWGDSVLLHSRAYRPSDTAESLSTVFSCVRGSDRLDHNQNRCAWIRRSVVYRIGTVKRIDLALRFDTTVARNGAAGPASIRATVYWGKTVALFEGRIDPVARSLQGSYIENGTAYDAVYDAGTSEASLKTAE